MNRRIFALLLCAIVTLVGCSKVDDGLEMVDATERNSALVENTKIDKALSLVNEANANMNRVSCSLSYASIDLDCHEDSRFVLIESPGSNCLKFGFEFIRNTGFQQSLYGDTNHPDRINWVVIGDGQTSTYCGYKFAHQFSINESYVIGMAVDYIVGNLTITETTVFRIDIPNALCAYNTVIADYEFVDTGYASLNDDNCDGTGGGGINLILP